MNNAKSTKLAITFLRMAIGWHFLYEGFSKWGTETWSAASYLANATGPFAGFYHWLADSEPLLKLVDLANIFGLMAIGLALFLGLATRIASVCGVLLLTLYYFAYPPFGGSLFGAADGNLFIVNKIALEALALLALLCVKEKGYGLCGLPLLSGKREVSDSLEQTDSEALSSRRESMKNCLTLPALGLLGWGAYRDRKTHGVDAVSGATIKVGAVDLSDLKIDIANRLVLPKQAFHCYFRAP